MSTQRELFEAMMKDFGVPVNKVPFISNERPGTILRIEPEPGSNIGGYYGFYCDFSFDKDGSFVEVGVWE